MKSKSFKSAFALCAAFVVVMATVVGASAGARVVAAATRAGARSAAWEMRSTVVSLNRAATILRLVLLRDRAAAMGVRLAPGRVLMQEPPAAPSAPAAPQPPARRQAPARPAPAVPAVPVPPSPPAPPAPPADDIDFGIWHQPNVVRVGQDYTVRAGENVGDVVIVGGNLRIEGHVRGDVVSVLGTVVVTSSGVVNGNFVNTGGDLTIEPGARLGRDMVTVGGVLNAPPEFRARGEQVVVGSRGLGEHVRSVIPWVTRGLMLGRPLVPSLRWIWGVVAIFFFLFLVLSLIVEGGVRQCVDVIAVKPLTTMLMGLLVLLLTGPISVILAVSIVGIIVLPFLACALLIASVLGQIAVLRWIGSSIVREDEEGGRAHAVRSFTIGFAIVTLIYMVPVIGGLAWVLLGVLGLGGATSALFRMLRKENPRAPRPPVVVPPPPPAPSPAATGAAPAVASAVVPTEGAASPLAFIPDAQASQPAADIPFAAAPGAPGAAHAIPPRPGEPSTFELLGLPRATLSQRLVAGGLDALLVLIVFQMMDFHERREMFWFLMMLTAYNAAFWTWRGTTIGGLICQLRVVRVDGRAMEFGDSVIRGLSSVFSLVVLGIGFFWIRLSGSPDRQAWHDIIAGTVVVRVPKSAPLR